MITMGRKTNRATTAVRRRLSQRLVIINPIAPNIVKITKIQPKIMIKSVI